MDKKTINYIAFILTVLGALNWGLVGLLNLNVVEMLFGTMPQIMQLIYVLMGLSAVYIFVNHKK